MTHIDVDTHALTDVAERLRIFERDTEQRERAVDTVVGRIDWEIRAAGGFAQALVAVRRMVETQASRFNAQAEFLRRAAGRYETADAAAQAALPGDPRKTAKGIWGWFSERWSRAWRAFRDGRWKIDVRAIVAALDRFAHEFVSTARRHREILLVLLCPPTAGVFPAIAVAHWMYQYREMAPMYAADDATAARLRNVLARPEYSAEAWQRADEAGREEIMNDLSRDVAGAMGVPVAPISFAVFPERTDGRVKLGQYDDDTGAIELNQKFLSVDRPPVSTVIHEYRHAYQHEALARDHDGQFEVAGSTREAWAENTRPGGYISGEKPEDFAAYEAQPIEKDARDMAEDAT